MKRNVLGSSVTMAPLHLDKSPLARAASTDERAGKRHIPSRPHAPGEAIVTALRWVALLIAIGGASSQTLAGDSVSQFLNQQQNSPGGAAWEVRNSENLTRYSIVEGERRSRDLDHLRDQAQRIDDAQRAQFTSTFGDLKPGDLFCFMFNSIPGISGAYYLNSAAENILG